MKVQQPITPVIYVLPKIPKGLRNPPGRPIVSAIGYLTYNISRLYQLVHQAFCFHPGLNRHN